MPFLGKGEANCKPEKIRGFWDHRGENLLGFRNGNNLVFTEWFKVILKTGPTKVSEDLFPGGFLASLEIPKIRFQLTSENFYCSSLSPVSIFQPMQAYLPDPVRTKKPKLQRVEFRKFKIWVSPHPLFAEEASDATWRSFQKSGGLCPCLNLWANSRLKWHQKDIFEHKSHNRCIMFQIW